MYFLKIAVWIQYKNIHQYFSISPRKEYCYKKEKERKKREKKEKEKTSVISIINNKMSVKTKNMKKISQTVLLSKSVQIAGLDNYTLQKYKNIARKPWALVVQSFQGKFFKNTRNFCLKIHLSSSLITSVSK